MKLSDLVRMAEGKDPDVLILQESDDGMLWHALEAQAEVLEGKIVIQDTWKKEVVFSGEGDSFPNGRVKTKKGKKS